MGCEITTEYNYLTASYFFILSLLGILLGKSFAYDMYSFLLILGASVIKIQTQEHVFHLVLMLSFHLLYLKYSSEIIKRWMRNERSDRKYRYHLPLTINHLLSVILLIFALIYDQIRMYVSISMMMIIMIMNFVSCWFFFPIHTPHYRITRIISLHLCGCYVMTVIGLLISKLCSMIPDRLSFLYFFIAQPVLNVYLSYGIFHQIQLITLLRAMNIGRHTVIKGQQIKIVLTVGRQGMTDHEL